MSTDLADRLESCLKPWAASAGIVAVSGGADSVALASMLATLQARGLLGKLVLGHVNHQLRGPDSDADEAFVRGLGQAWGVPVHCQRIDVRAAGGNLESAARRLRYRWLAALARAEEASWVATGHTADDQAETVLHRFLRGAGLRGLGGIPCQRQLAPGLTVVRPLLKITRQEILAYLQAANLSFREDTSNCDLRFTRNRLRHELLPYLARHFNPAITALLGRLAEQAEAVQAMVLAEANKLLAETELPRAGAVLVFDGPRLARAPRHLLREMFRQVWRREGWSEDAMGFAGWDRLAAVAAGERAAGDLAAGVQAQRTERVLRLRQRTKDKGAGSSFPA